MLADLLSPANYIMVSRDAIRILGLNTAVYCSELLTIYKKVVSKKKFVNENKFFVVDRDYITKQTSLEVDDQLKCDLNLAKVNVIKIDEENPNQIFFDIEIFASVLASEDIKLLEKVSEKVKAERTNGTKKAQKDYTIQKIKESIECKTPEILFKLREWVESIFESGKGLSRAQVKMFKDTLDNYCNGDVKKALRIIDIGIVHSYVDCKWCIGLYEKEVNNPNTASRVNNVNRVSLGGAQQRKTVEVSEEIF